MDDIKNLTTDQAIKNLRTAGYTTQADAFEKSLKGKTTINAGDIGNSTPDIPTPKPQTKPDLSLGVLSSSAGAENFANLTQEDILSQKAGLYTKVLDLIGKTKGESARKTELLEEEGVGDLRKQIAGFKNQMAAEERAFELERRRLLENPEGVFGPGALQGQISNLESKSLQRRADIAILQNATVNNLQASLDIVDMKLDAEFGPAKEELDIFKQQLEFASPFLGEISSYLKDQADEKEKEIQQQQAWKKDILGLAIDAQQAGNSTLAQQLVSMSNGELTEESYTQAISSSIEAGVFSPKGTTTKTIDILDAQRYNELYPGANIVPGMTVEDANKIIADMGALTPEQQITNEITKLKNNQYTKEEAIAEINKEITNPVVKRQALAKIEEIYGTEPKSDKPSFTDRFKGLFSNKNPKPITGESPLDKKLAELSDYKAVDMGFFQGLFKR